MPDFKDVSSPAGLTALNNHLSTRGYIDGFRPSAQDADMYTKVPSGVNNKDYPHLARWQTHVGSFCSCDRSKWGGAKGGAAAATTTTTTTAPAAADGAGSAKKAGKQGDKKEKPAAAAAAKPAPEEEDDEPIQKWISDDEEEDENEKRIHAIGAAKIAADKAKGKVAPIEKSSLILDVKPEESDTDMAKMEADVRAITQEGVQWTAAQLVPVAFGIKKLRIMAIIVDSLVSTDDLREKIEKLEGVQSTDLYAHTKV